MKVLSLDRTGTPVSWLTTEEACHYYATDSVAYDFGDFTYTFHGGIQRSSGMQSKISVKSIISLKSKSKRSSFETGRLSARDNYLLFGRDLHICAYCGGEFDDYSLTRDHVHPKSRHGNNSWMNLVTSCFSCNNKKDNRTPEEARMPLLYVPYVPCRYERFILENRRILSDQMEFLRAKLPSHSRHKDGTH